MKLYAAAFIVLAGCASVEQGTKVVYKTQVVKEVVQVPCKVTTPIPPKWMLDTLDGTESFYTIAAAAVAEIEQRIAYEGELRAALKACQ